LPFYVLLKLLYREEASVSWQTRLLSEGKVLRRCRHHQRSIEALLVKYWSEYKRMVTGTPINCYVPAAMSTNRL